MARILIVDDEEIVRNVLRAYLRSSGHTLVEAVDGQDALAVHRLQPAHVIITDNHMPRMGGAELVKVVRRESPDVRVIVISGLPVDAALRESADEVLSKPFGREDLLAAIRRAVKTAITV